MNTVHSIPLGFLVTCYGRCSVEFKDLGPKPEPEIASEFPIISKQLKSKKTKKELGLKYQTYFAEEVYVDQFQYFIGSNLGE